MIYRGFDIKTGWPLGQPVQVLQGEKVVKEFPFETTDETVMDWIDAEKRREREQSK